MSDNSQDLRIHIISDADTKGFTTASAATAKLKVDTSDLSDETKKQLGLLDPAAGGHEKLGKKIEEAGGHMEKGGREMRKLGNEIGQLAGITGAGELAMGKMGAAIFAVGASLEFLLGTYKDIQSAITGPINIQVHDDAALIKSNAEALTNYADARKKITEAAAGPEAAYARENKLLEAKLKLTHDVMKAEEEEALAALATRESRMSPEAYAAEKSKLQAAFGQRGTEADEATQRAKIDAMQKQAAALEADAAKKKAAGEAQGTGNADAQGAAKKNAEEATKALEEINANIKLLQRIAHPDNAEYEGLGGEVQKRQDYWTFYKRYGYGANQGDAMASEQLRKSQAESEIALGETAAQQQARLQKRREDLLSQAGTESGQATNLRAEIKAAIAEYNAEVQTHIGTETIAGATSAINQEHAAEGNNTQQGTRDALAALAAGTTAAANVQSQLQAVGDTNKELHDALFHALQDVAAENRRLAALIRNMPGGNK